MFSAATSSGSGSGVPAGERPLWVRHVWLRVGDCSHYIPDPSKRAITYSVNLALLLRRVHVHMPCLLWFMLAKSNAMLVETERASEQRACRSRNVQVTRARTTRDTKPICKSRWDARRSNTRPICRTPQRAVACLALGDTRQNSACSLNLSHASACHTLSAAVATSTVAV